jgi:hypothetical protein
MKLSTVVARLRNFDIQPFGQNIAGAAELGSVQADTLLEESAYIIQTLETASPSQIEGDVTQRLTEGFAVVVVLRNDLSQADKTGLTAFDSLYYIRQQLFNSLVGWEIEDEDETDGYYSESPVYFKGGMLLDINPAWMWYQFEFEFRCRISRTYVYEPTDEFRSIRAQYVLTPDTQIPLKGPESLPGAVKWADLDQVIDLTVNLLAGAFSSAFSAGFDDYEGD